MTARRTVRLLVLAASALGIALVSAVAAAPAQAAAPTSTVTVGANPQLPAVTAAYAFVPNHGSSNVSVIDRATNSVTKVITVSGAPTGAVVVGSKVWVRLTDAKQYAVIDPSTLAVEAQIPVGGSPSLPAVATTGLSAAVSNATDGTVTVVNVGTNTVTATVAVGKSPQRPTFGTGANAAKLFVPNGADGTVSVIDALTNAVSSTVTIGGTLGDAIATPDGKYVLLPQKGATTTLRRVDQNSLAVELLLVTDGDTISYPVNVVQNGAAYIAPAAGMIQAGSIDPAQALDSQDAGQWTGGTLGTGAVSADGKWALYSSPQEQFFHSAPYVTLVNTSNLKMTAFLKVGTNPASLAFAPTGALAYVSNADDGTVSVLDLSTNYWPSAPRKVKAKEQRNGWGMTTTVSWKAPKRAGAGGIKKTVVYPTDTMKHCSTKKTSCTVKNLSAHKGYTYFARATTPYAIGAAGMDAGK